jgi:RNA recognition motif-containing protein
MQGLRHNEYYRLIVQVMNEAGGRSSSLSPSPNRGLNRGSRHGSDIKAIFVGSLPETVTEDLLRTLFSKYGSILDCKVIRKPLDGKFGLLLFV